MIVRQDRYRIYIAIICIMSILSACGSDNPAKVKIRKNTKILEMDPENTEALYSRGNAYCELKEYEKAVIDYNAALKIDPYLTKVYLNRGCAFVEIAEYEKAVSDLNRVQEDTDHEAILFVVYTCRGYALKKLGDFDSAVADYKKAFEIDPEYVELNINKAKARASSLFD